MGKIFNIKWTMFNRLHIWITGWNSYWTVWQFLCYVHFFLFIKSVLQKFEKTGSFKTFWVAAVTISKCRCETQKRGRYPFTSNHQKVNPNNVISMWKEYSFMSKLLSWNLRLCHSNLILYIVSKTYISYFLSNIMHLTLLSLLYC